MIHFQIISIIINYYCQVRLVLFTNRIKLQTIQVSSKKYTAFYTTYFHYKITSKIGILKCEYLPVALNGGYL